MIKTLLIGAMLVVSNLANSQILLRLDTINGTTSPVPSNTAIDEKLDTDWVYISGFFPVNTDLSFNISQWGAKPRPPKSNYVLIEPDTSGGWNIRNEADSLSQSDSTIYFFNNKFNSRFTLYTLSVGTKNKNKSPLPIELSYFQISQKGMKWIFEWKTHSEIRNKKFKLQLKYNNETPWHDLGSYRGNGTTTIPHKWHTVIPVRKNCQPCYFRLKQIDYDNSYEIYGPIAKYAKNNNSSNTTNNHKIYIRGLGELEIKDNKLIKYQK